MSWRAKRWWRIAGGLSSGRQKIFAVVHVHQQAVAVVDFRAVIIELAFRVLAEPEHAGQRRQADGLDRLAIWHRPRECVGFAEIKHRLDVWPWSFRRAG